jgi:hypothetical protein
MMAWVGIVVTLVDSAGAEAFHYPDPAGGFFDTAGDFDRLLGQPGDWLVWGIIDEYGVTRIGSDEAALLVRDLVSLLTRAEDGPERHGLERLAIMAADCAADPGALLVFHGD